MGKTVTKSVRRILGRIRQARITARRAKGTSTAKGKPVRE